MGNWIKDSCNWTFSDQNNPKIKKHSPQISVRDIVIKKRKKTNELEIKSGMFFSQQLTQIKKNVTYPFCTPLASLHIALIRNSVIYLQIFWEDFITSCTSIVRVAKTMLNQSRQTNNIPMIIIVHCCDDVTPMEVEVNYNNNPRDSKHLLSPPITTFMNAENPWTLKNKSPFMTKHSDKNIVL